MIAAVLLLVLGQAGKPENAPVQFKELAVSGYDPSIKGKIISFKIQVKNISNKALRFGRISTFRKGFDYNNDGNYVIAPYTMREDGKENNEIGIRTTYLIQSSSEVLYPNETMEILVEMQGCNFPVKNLSPSFIFARAIGGPEVVFIMNQNGKELTLENWEAQQEKKRSEEAKKNQEKEIEDKKTQERLAEKKIWNDKAQKKMIPINEAIAALKPKVDDLDKAYRELAKKATAADKADQFEDAKRFKEESLKGYAEWKKEKAKLDMLNAELKRLKNDIEP